MTNARFPRLRLPSPGDIVTPLVTIENSLISAVQAPFQGFGLPVPPRIVGPFAIVQQIAGQLPAPPQPPELPQLPKLPTPGG